ncbi:Neuralized-like protein 4 [Armadillidium vulgare]|nr:Neuralized-like protein 4 [Armadillidium vulgare]
MKNTIKWSKNKIFLVRTFRFIRVTKIHPKQYAQPVGWCRFSLVTAVGENNESWHMAYHGIKGGAIRRMLDKGELLFAGNPPKQYAQPVGWCRFSLVTAVGENNESWHMAYHGIKGGAIRRMLDKGELLFAGELGVNTRLANRKSRDDASDGSVLIFSPSVVYASLDELAPPISKSTKAVCPTCWMVPIFSCDCCR